MLPTVASIICFLCVDMKVFCQSFAMRALALKIPGIRSLAEGQQEARIFNSKLSSLEAAMTFDRLNHRPTDKGKV